MTDRDFNTLLAGIEAGLYRIASNEKLGVYGRQELADGALEALHDLRTRVEKVEALPEKFDQYAKNAHKASIAEVWGGDSVLKERMAGSSQAWFEARDELTQALQGGDE